MINKPIITVFLLIILSQLCSSQDISEIDKQIDSLNQKKALCEKELQLINVRIANLEKEKNNILLQKDRMEGVPVRLTDEVRLKDQPKPFGNVITILQKGQRVTIIGYSHDYYEIIYGNGSGYIFKDFVENNPRLDRLRSTTHENEKEENKIKEKMLEQEHIDYLVKAYGEKDAKRILSHSIWRGMSDHMTIESIGPPNSINKTVYEGGASEQWVYSNRYLYFKNHVLVGWQEFK